MVRSIDSQVGNEAIQALEALGIGEVHRPREGLRTRGDRLKITIKGRFGQRVWSTIVRVPVTTAAVRTLATQLRSGKNKTLLLTTHVGRKLAEELRQNGICFADAAGNAWIETEGLVVWVTGQPGPANFVRPGRVFRTAAGLRLVHALLRDAGLQNRPYRSIARIADIGLGTVADMLRELGKTGYLRRVGRRRLDLENGRELRQRFEVGYAETLRPKLFLGAYRVKKAHSFEALADEAGRIGKDILVGGELGAALLTGKLRPGTATLHLHPRQKEAVVGTLGLLPDREGPITLLAVDSAGLEDEAAPAGRPVLADPFLIRAEILILRDPRAGEIADEILDRHIPERFR